MRDGMPYDPIHMVKVTNVRSCEKGRFPSLKFLKIEIRGQSIR